MYLSLTMFYINVCRDALLLLCYISLKFVCDIRKMCNCMCYCTYPNINVFNTSTRYRYYFKFQSSFGFAPIKLGPLLIALLRIQHSNQMSYLDCVTS